MKIILHILVIGFLFSSQVQAQNFFDGCFQTVKINDRDVTNGPDTSRTSQIYSAQSEFFYDIQTKESLKTKIISLLTGFKDGYYYYTNPLIFEELGNLEITENSFRYEFSGKVYYRNSNYQLQPVDFATKAKLDKTDDIVTGIITQQSQTLNRDIQISFVLSKVLCEQD